MKKYFAAAILFLFSGLLFLQAAGKGAEEPYEIMIENLTYGNGYEDTEQVEQAINEIILPKINCTVKIEHVPLNNIFPLHKNKFRQGEKMDIICSFNLSHTMDYISHQYCIPLNGLLQEYGTGITKLFKDELHSMQLDGRLYVLPMNLYYSKAGGLLYNAELAREYGISIPSRLSSADDLTRIFKTLHEKNPSIYGTTQAMGDINLSEYFYNIETFGYTYMNCGVIFSQDTEIRNFYETKECRNYYKLLHHWKEEGYMTPNTMTAAQLPQRYFSNQDIFCLPIYYHPLSLSMEQSKYNFEVGVSQMTDAVRPTSFIWNPVWAVSSTSERPEKAMQFLNLMYTNPQIANLLNYGIEGIHYKKATEHTIEPLSSGSTKPISKYQSLFCSFGDQAKILHWAPAEDDSGQALADFHQASARFPSLGYTFDITPVQLQFVTVNEVLDTYVPPLECGMADDVDRAIDTLLDALKSAGMDEIIAENQRQLDKWLSRQSNGR